MTIVPLFLIGTYVMLSSNLDFANLYGGVGNIIAFLTALMTYLYVVLTGNMVKMMIKGQQDERQLKVQPLLVPDIKQIVLFSPKRGNDDRWYIALRVISRISNLGNSPAINVDSWATSNHENFSPVSICPTQTPIISNAGEEEMSLMPLDFFDDVERFLQVNSSVIAHTGPTSQNAMISVKVLYKSFTEGIFLAEASYRLMPKNQEAARKMSNWQERIVTRPTELVECNETVALSGILERGSYKITRLSNNEYDSLIATFSESIDFWTCEESDELHCQ